MAMGDEILSAINEARAAHKQAQRRAEQPVECPIHLWPLERSDGIYHCKFGGHVVVPGSAVT